MASQNRYKEYAETGVEWLASLPINWHASRLKFLIDELESGVSVNAADQPAEPGEIGVLKTSCVYTRVFRAQENKTVFAEERARVKCPLRKGSIVVSRMNTPALVGAAAYVESNYPGLYLPDRLWQTVFVGEPKLDSKFLYYFMFIKGFRDQISNFAEGASSSMQSISKDDFLSITVATPSIEEQQKIANFLDHETAKIDTLIEKQQQLIKLLKEKRRAVISHAVTKGLNPDAPMRDSGVEWLGEVPAHWSVSKFGYISSVVRGGSPRPAGDPLLFDGDYSPWVTVAEITKDDDVYLIATESYLTKKGSEQCRVFNAGTLVLSNSGATLGVPKILSINANANDGVVGFENMKLDAEFAYYYLSTLTDDIRERTKQGSGQPNLNTDIVKAEVVPIPPDVEANEIVLAIRDIRSTYVGLVNKAGQGIILLQERRAALVSAAVTGKIDVRNWQPQTPTEAQRNKEATP